MVFHRINKSNAIIIILYLKLNCDKLWEKKKNILMQINSFEW